MQAALPLCTARLIFCLKNAVDLGSHVAVDKRLPISLTKEMASGPHGPRVSTVTGVKL